MYLLNHIDVKNAPVATRFTFHYVSIKSETCRLHHASHENLHSTMYLLNPDTADGKGGVSEFTFHYVSIKSSKWTSCYHH